MGEEQLRARLEESRRFGSRAYARELLSQSGQLERSDVFERRVLRAEGRVEAPPTVAQGRRRLLPFEVLLASGGASMQLFAPGPFDELRCYQRRVATAHRVEYLTWLNPHDVGTEGYRSLGSFRLAAAEALPVLGREFWRRLRAACGARALPSARVRGRRVGADGLPREGTLGITPAMSSGAFQREGQPDLAADEVQAALRAVPTSRERIAWLESAFRRAAPDGVVLHRYYLDAEANAWLVRQEGSARVLVAMAKSAEAVPGLWIYPESRVRVAA